MEKYASIEQFKNVIKHVRDNSNYHGIPLPTLSFIGTVKLHGTNSAFNVAPDDTYVFQSRERELTIESDNAGFAMWGERKIEELFKTIKNVRQLSNWNGRIVVYSEWCGGNIQKSVALSQLPKMFVIFNVTLVDDEGNRTELTPDEIKSVVNRTDEIKCIYDYKTWTIDIDFNDPSAVQNQLVGWTLEVEDECPVGKAHGITKETSDQTTGEGIVWWNPEKNLKFKVKGSDHQNSKVKTLKEIAAVDIEKMNSIKELVSNTVTENRLKQGLDKLGEMGLEIDVKNTSAFLRWVTSDVLKEEKDTIVASGFDVKEIMPVVSEAAKQFWFKTLNSNE